MGIASILKSASYLLFCAMMILASGSSALAQETTGSIEGTVSDASGARVPGATVKVESAVFNRSTTANAEGFYRVLQVPPGTYKVSVTAVNFSPAVAGEIPVVLGKTVPVDFNLVIGIVTAEVVVNAASVSRIDRADNTIQTNITQRLIEALPKGAGMTSLLKISPAARLEPLSGQVQVDGASGSENSFIIDGQEFSNFRTGILLSNNNIPFQFIQEMQIKTSGFEAQFGGATGGVINVATKGGTNEFHGSAAYQVEPHALWPSPRPALNSFRSGTGANFVQINEYLHPQKDNFTNTFPSFALGGPVRKDRVWFFMSYAPQIFDTTRTSNYLTQDPRTRTQTAQETYHVREHQEYAQGRVDTSLTKTLRLSATYTWNPDVVRGALPVGNISLGGAIPAVNFGGEIGTLTGHQLTDHQGGRRNATNVTTQVVWTPKTNLGGSFRFSRGFLNEKLSSYFIPQQTIFNCGGLTVPSTAGCSQGFSNFPNNNNIAYDVSIRLNFEGDVSYMVNHFGGRHEFKGGYQNTLVSNDVSRGYFPYGIVRLQYGLTINDLTGRNDPVTPGTLGAGSLTRSGTLGSASNHAQSLYIQDRWQPIKHLSINAGVRIEKEDLPSFNGFAPPVNFGWADKIVPRLGFAYDLSGRSKSKLFASYGRFTDRLKFELARGAFGADLFFTDFFEISPANPRYDYYTLARVRGSNLDTLGGQCPIVGGNGLSRCQVNSRSTNDPKATIFDGKVDPNLKPFTQSEFTVGFERELSAGYLLSARYTYKNVDHAIEDAGFPNAQGSVGYVYGNPGEGLHAQTAKDFGYVKTTKPERRYDALEIRVDRRFAKNYSFNLAYTYSRLYGNYSGLSSSDEGGRNSPGVSRLFDLPHVGFTAAGIPENGRLATDRPHVLSAYGIYDFDWFGRLKNGRTQFSFFTTAQSGTPMTSFYNFFAAAVLYGRGNLGRTEVLTNTDFAVSHRVGLGERYGLTFHFNVLNVFNEANVTGLQTSLTGINPSIATLNLPVKDEAAAINYILTTGIVTQFNTFLNDPTAPQRKQTALERSNRFQDIRQAHLGVRFTF